MRWMMDGCTLERGCNPAHHHRPPPTHLPHLPHPHAVDKFTKGLYAIRVMGRLPEEIEEELKAAGVTYRPRDGTSMD